MKTILLAALLIAFPYPVAFAQDSEHPLAKAIAAKLTNPKKTFTLMVKATVKEGQAESFIAAFAAAVEPTWREEGCFRYELNQVDGENIFVVYEQWASLEKLKAHLGAPHTVKLLETITPILAAEPEITVLTPKANPVERRTPAEEEVLKATKEIREALEAVKKEGKQANSDGK